MNGGRKFSEVQTEHFLAGIASQSTPEDRPVRDVIDTEYEGNTDAYIEDMLHYDPGTERYLDIISYRTAKPPASTRAPQEAAE